MYKHKSRLSALMRMLATPALLLTTLGLAADQPALPIDVRAETGEYDVRTGAHHLSGNVRIARGELIVNADDARSFSTEDGRVARIELSGSPTTWNDVLEDGSRVDGESDEIIYDFTRNIITMVGNARITNIQGTFSGSTLVYDLDSQNLVGDGGVRLIIEPATAERAARETVRPQSDPDN